MVRLLVIGLDGMDYFMAKRTIPKHRFKNFRPILKKLLVEETHTGPSWASFYTGLDKEAHGVVDGWGRNVGESNSYKDIQDYVFWNLLEKAGYDVYTDNLPITPSGFPFAPEKEKDVVNWVHKPSEVTPVFWRQTIRKMSFEDVISKVRTHSLNLIDGKQLENRDLVFVQFSFLDRIGHVFSFKNDDMMMKSYELAYELVDKLFKLTKPQYLIVISDHGFWKNYMGHLDASCATMILNDDSYRFFIQNNAFKRFSIQTKLFKRFCVLRDLVSNLKHLRTILKSVSFTELLGYLFACNYVRQTDIFDVILEVFNLDYKKPTQKIQKMEEHQEARQEHKAIKERLERLGYL
jgi:predicted AlkP superfamily phosphohydrolase/phosphomutase